MARKILCARAARRAQLLGDTMCSWGIQPKAVSICAMQLMAVCAEHGGGVGALGAEVAGGGGGGG